MNKQLVYCLLGFLLLTACKKEVIPTTATTATETVGKVTVQNLDFNYLSARSQVKIEDKNGSQSSGMSLRMKKDSIIWVSVLPGLGIEAARLKVTRDSVFMMNRIHKEYLATDFKFLSKKFQVDITFDILQAILTGNYQPNGTEKVQDEAQLQHVQQLRQNQLFDYFIGKESQKLQQLHITDQRTSNQITVKYDSFQPIGAVSFAHAMAAQVLHAGQTSSFTLSHNRITIADEVLEFPFAVPADYKRI
ncbi:DUF4292 domain-containing protein [Pontibacter qinzhouensis]|uniref:DUF4292 domain-containing protein n=1 Tax=Pontibacter qinzhouensis TaxID=2603253 RepID=A0A5C8K5K1_9BACT|nr:DUF4292 domain-containing protein [Pontibacter qinzhouensis]TXK46035.1 DUF4292 domain-containing protein [Pontibacter qinzhouensis]